jgi:hypothetical protein
MHMLYGCTEVGIVTTKITKHLAFKDWVWCQLNPNVDIRWRPAGDGVFELEDLRGERHVVSVENLPDIRGYATHDL